MSLKDAASGAHAAAQIRLQWERGAASRDAHRPLRLSAAALAGSSVELHLGGLAVPAALSYEEHPQVGPGLPGLCCCICAEHDGLMEALS